jgi:NAD(P)H-flavin reductase
MGACGSGPNVIVTTPAVKDEDGAEVNRGSYQMVTGVYNLERSLAVLEQALEGDMKIPEDVLHRTKLRSDAIRKQSSNKKEDLEEAEALLTEAIDLELSGVEVTPPPGSTPESRAELAIDRLRELRMTRGNVRGSQILSNFEASMEDFDSVIEDDGTYTQAWMEKGKILRRARRPQDALDCFRTTLELGTSQEPPPKGNGMHKYMVQWLERMIDELEERLLEQEAVDGGEFGAADAADESMTDSGDGSGRWKVEKITGLSWDSCVYHLVNHPPAEPHPYPNDAWHVNVRFGGTVREYTPVSDYAAWEAGKIDVLVKTYATGTVSKKFAMLRQASPYTALEEQPCWVLTSAPALTLKLPELAPAVVLAPPPSGPLAPVTDIGLVVGGTGIAPALQILREIASDGAFGPDCNAVVLYSSRTPADVLMLEELRQAEAGAPGRIKVLHTLTSYEAAPDPDAPAPSFDAGENSIPGRHYHFASQWNPHVPESGELRTGAGEEAGLRGRATPEMLAGAMPAPGPGTRIVVSGPAQMWEDVRDMCLGLGHQEAALVELESETKPIVAVDAAGEGEGGAVADPTPAELTVQLATDEAAADKAPSLLRQLSSGIRSLLEDIAPVAPSKLGGLAKM